MTTFKGMAGSFTALLIPFTTLNQWIQLAGGLLGLIMVASAIRNKRMEYQVNKLKKQQLEEQIHERN